MLSGGTQRRALPRYQCKEMKILNITFQRVGIEATTYRVYSRRLVYLRHDWRMQKIVLVKMARRVRWFLSLGP